MLTCWEMFGHPSDTIVMPKRLWMIRQTLASVKCPIFVTFLSPFNVYLLIRDPEEAQFCRPSSPPLFFLFLHHLPRIPVYSKPFRQIFYRRIIRGIIPLHPIQLICNVLGRKTTSKEFDNSSLLNFCNFYEWVSVIRILETTDSTTTNSCIFTAL